ncbi:MAG: activase [Proteobacteria bacterium]|nr:activase [Pseudomonadota bacterium]MBU4472346.1 activase [Pseudomonadota bacterium]MCG2752042.1 acyl-CoA dehydratase activase [Desulfobacteraceae bacterium]
MQSKTINGNPVQNILGLCLGATTISMVHLRAPPGSEKPNGALPEIASIRFYTHEGNPKKTLQQALEEMDLSRFDKIAATGRKFRHYVNFTSISESEAVEYAYQFVKAPGISSPAIVSAGGETFMVYALNQKGQISNVITGNKCASGTGEFFLQQLRRMNVTLEEAALWAADETPYGVSGRCSVFCKSDCTHATNKGIPKANVTAGLCRMMASKVLELLKNIDRTNIMITGGVTQNKMMVECLKQEIPGLIIPREAACFEALGAALWATRNPTDAFTRNMLLFNARAGSTDTLAPLSEFEHRVEFKTMAKDQVKAGDICILGLDVGSTTTKAVLMRKQDNALLASVYLRTNGDPVGASRNCYGAILEQIQKAGVLPEDIQLTGLGVCGSGRQIAGLHALTDGVINEIIAHAEAAVFFDDKVDTILEIGGQDAKYTYIVNGVPADYAMNEACSAGTGSFLEESALETLGVKMEDIAAIARTANFPPNFNDQCAAFIASDIKNAIHEGASHEDIVAGLVYSICMNYTNRVKGNRKVGEKIFMQGGVCYNRAVPLAMASLLGKSMVVPPEPGLMGAFGVALEVKKRLRHGLLEEKTFDLKNLYQREVLYKESFVCKGGKTRCDRKCDIASIEVEGKTYPFGGACNRYYNLRRRIEVNVEELDLVQKRQDLIFHEYAAFAAAKEAPSRGAVGINKSFMTNTYYPLYSTFFSELGMEPFLSRESLQKGIDRRGSAFCYPSELAHGYFYSLLTGEKPLDYLFLPHFKAVPTQIQAFTSQVCPIVQGESFYLAASFKKEIKALEAKGLRILSPLLDLSQGDFEAKKPLVAMAVSIGIPKAEAARAFEKALKVQKDCFAEMKDLGRKALITLESQPDKTGVVLFARAYNGFVEEAHMGIPNKFASRGILTLPYDFLDFEEEEAKHHMYWGIGQRLMKATRMVKKHPQLFGAFITNFSCGPDSFLITYFRDIMEQKPSLTLELDSHSADAGLETRIEAFLDIVHGSRKMGPAMKKAAGGNHFVPAVCFRNNGIPKIQTGNGKVFSFTDPAVNILIPSMGKISSEALAAAFRSTGYKTLAHPPADEAILKLGRANTSCKECLPLILTTGTLLNYIENHRKKDEVLVYFMPTTNGPCRFGQYATFMEDLVRRMRIPDVAVFSLSAENAYGGLGNGFEKKACWAIMLADVMEDIRSMLLANAQDPDEAMEIFGSLWKVTLEEMERGVGRAFQEKLRGIAHDLGNIPLRRPVSEVPVISLIGEIFVRRDGISRRHITEQLALKGFAVTCSPIMEWLYYLDYLALRNQGNENLNFKERIGIFIKTRFKKSYELRLKSILSKSGLISSHPIEIETIVKNGKDHVSVNLGGEAILTVGSALTDVASHACGVISIGPFGCMPTRIAEAILTENMNREGKLATVPKDPRMENLLADMEDLPFLSIESDGSPFPQLINAKLETFCLRALRLNEKMLAQGQGC